MSPLTHRSPPPDSARAPARLTLAVLLLAAFAVGACSDDDDDDNGPSTGNIDVTTTTIGTSVDADGYSVSLDGGAGIAMDANDVYTYPAVATGNHSVALAGVAANCLVTSGTPLNANVTAGVTTDVDFTVTCTTPLAGRSLERTQDPRRAHATTPRKPAR